MTTRRKTHDGARSARNEGRAVSYVHVSSQEQEREGYSIPAQVTLTRRYAAGRDFSLVREFRDVETAKRAGRPGFNAMVAFFRQNPRTRILIVDTPDRLTRNLKDWATLGELDLKIHFIRDHSVHTRNSRSSDKLLVDIKMVIAKNFIDNLSDETRKGQREKAAQGFWPSYAPLGYNNVVQDGRKIIVPDPVPAPLVTALFETYSTGRHSLKELTQFAYERGLRSRKGNRLSKSTIYNLLRSRTYTGDFTWDGTTYHGTHPPLVSQELWALVQDILGGRAATRRRRAKHDFAFSRLITCGHCGCALVGERKKQRYTYYHCTGYRGPCPEPYTREEVLEASFTNLLRTLSFDAGLVDWMVETLRFAQAKDRDEHEQAIRRLERESGRLQRRLDEMYDDKLDGRISADEYDRKSAALCHERDDLTATITRHNDVSRTYVDEGVKLLNLARRAAELFERQSPGEKRRLLNFLLSNCSWKDGTLHAEFRQPFDMLAVAAKPPSGSNGGGSGGKAVSENWLLR